MRNSGAGRTAVFILVALGASLAAAAPAGEAAKPAAQTPKAGVVQWRGDGTGRYLDAEPPLEWAKDKNVLWTAEAEPSYSSPIAVAGKVFVCTEPGVLLCLDAQSGKKLWEKSHTQDDLPDNIKAIMQTMMLDPGDSGYAVPTPLCDGKNVFAEFGNGIVVCYDLAGNRQWIQLLKLAEEDTPKSISPVLAGEVLLAYAKCLHGLDARTGEVLWTNDKVQVSYATPAVTRIGGTDVAIAGSGQLVRVKDGAILAENLGCTQYVTPIVSGGVVYVMDSEATAYKLPEKAEPKSKAEKVWSVQLEGEFFASPVLHEGLLHTVSNSGDYFVVDAKDGKIVFKKKIESLTPNFYPSTILAGKHLVLTDVHGQSLILVPGREYQEVRKNELGDGSSATPMPFGKCLLIRGQKTVYCIGAK